MNTFQILLHDGQFVLQPAPVGNVKLRAFGSSRERGPISNMTLSRWLGHSERLENFSVGSSEVRKRDHCLALYSRLHARRLSVPLRVQSESPPSLHITTDL